MDVNSQKWTREELVRSFRDRGYEVRSKEYGTVRVNRAGACYLYIPAHRLYHADTRIQTRTSQDWRELHKVSVFTGSFVDESSHRSGRGQNWRQMWATLGPWLEVTGYVQFEMRMLHHWNRAATREADRAEWKIHGSNVRRLDSLLDDLIETDSRRSWRNHFSKDLYESTEFQQARSLLLSVRSREKGLMDQLAQKYIEKHGELP